MTIADRRLRVVREQQRAPATAARSSAPFDTLAQAETASAANHTVFVFDGDNTTTGYGGNGYTMNAGERLIGEHEGLTVDADRRWPARGQTLHPANPGAHPTLTDTDADVIDLDDGNEVRGFNIDPQGTGGGIAGSTGERRRHDRRRQHHRHRHRRHPARARARRHHRHVQRLQPHGQHQRRDRRAAQQRRHRDLRAHRQRSRSPRSGAAGLRRDRHRHLGTSTFDAITVTGSGTGGVSLTNTTGTTTFGDLALTTTSGATRRVRALQRRHRVRPGRRHRRT